jgi:hypothetical protein
MLALVAAAERFVSRHDLDALDPDDWQYRVARSGAAKNARGRDVLCFGDSMMKNAVMPRVVGARCGLRGYNLAICGAQAPASYLVLRRVLKGGARPSAALVEFNPALLAFPPDINTYHWPYLVTWPEALELGWRSGNAAFAGAVLARRALPSLRARESLRGWVVDALAGRFPKYRYVMPTVFRHWARHDGAQVMPCKPGEAWDVATHQLRYYPAGWRPDRTNLDYLDRFLALAGSRGMTVYWLIPPAVPALQEAKERAGFDRDFLAFVRSCQARHPNLVVIDGRHAGYDPRVFFDPDHLGGEGACALSEDLGDALRRLRRGAPADRWVTLPRGRARPEGRVPESVMVEMSRPLEPPTVLR